MNSHRSRNCHSRGIAVNQGLQPASDAQQSSSERLEALTAYSRRNQIRIGLFISNLEISVEFSHR